MLAGVDHFSPMSPARPRDGSAEQLPGRTSAEDGRLRMPEVVRSNRTAQTKRERERERQPR